MTNVLFVGGPLDGELRAVPNGTVQAGHDIVVPAPVEPLAAFMEENLDPTAMVEIETKRYRMGEYDPGTGLHIYLYEDQRPPTRAGSGPMVGGRWRWCRECDVKWWGEPVCWYCDQPLPERNASPAM